MKKSRDSTLPLDWLKIARKDWNRIAYMLEKDDCEAASFFFQQCLEKYLKAFLLSKGWHLRRIHELDALLDDAVSYNPELEELRELCERVSGYYMVDRYPLFDDLELTSGDIKEDLERAKEFIHKMFPNESID